MEQQIKKKHNYPFIVLTIGAVVFFVYTVFAFISTWIYIHELVTVQSLDVIENIRDIISYFASNCGVYLFYGFMCYGAAMLFKGSSSSKTESDKTDQLPEESPIDSATGESEDSDSVSTDECTDSNELEKTESVGDTDDVTEK